MIFLVVVVLLMLSLLSGMPLQKVVCSLLRAICLSKTHAREHIIYEAFLNRPQILSKPLQREG